MAYETLTKGYLDYNCFMWRMDTHNTATYQRTNCTGEEGQRKEEEEQRVRGRHNLMPPCTQEEGLVPVQNRVYQQQDGWYQHLQGLLSPVVQRSHPANVKCNSGS